MIYMSGSLFSYENDVEAQMSESGGQEIFAVKIGLWLLKEDTLTIPKHVLSCQSATYSPTQKYLEMNISKLSVTLGSRSRSKISCT